MGPRGIRGPGRPPRRAVLTAEVLEIVTPFLAPAGRREVQARLELWFERRIVEEQRRVREAERQRVRRKGA